MTGRRLGRGLLGLVFVLVATASPALAEGPATIPAGTIELGIAGGYSVSFNNSATFAHDGQQDLPTVYGTWGLLRLGAFLTDEHGPALLRGNLELTLEPTFAHLESHPSTDVYGAALLLRWLFVGNGTIRPYLQGGGGVIGGKIEPRTGNCDPNFILEVGPGIVFFVTEHVALDLGYRFNHISNGDRCSPNFSVNSNMGVVGLSYFFD